MVQKIVINACFGGFGLSEKAMMRYAEIKGITLYPEMEEYASSIGPTYYTVPKDKRTHELKDWSSQPVEARMAYNRASEKEQLYDNNIRRNDPALVQVVEELGLAASGRFARLRVVEVPDDVEWFIDEYDGNESVEEEHRSWS